MGEQGGIALGHRRLLLGLGLRGLRGAPVGVSGDTLED